MLVRACASSVTPQYLQALQYLTSNCNELCASACLVCPCQILVMAMRGESTKRFSPKSERVRLFLRSSNTYTNLHLYGLLTLNCDRKLAIAN